MPIKMHTSQRLAIMSSVPQYYSTRQYLDTYLSLGLGKNKTLDVQVETPKFHQLQLVSWRTKKGDEVLGHNNGALIKIIIFCG